MRVLFVTHDGTSHEPLGLLYLSGSLRRAGHETRACMQSKTIRTVQEWDPDFVAFQVLTGDQDRWGSVAREVKDRFPVKTIFGGPHFLFFAKSQQEAADYVIRGDAEEAIVDVVEGRSHRDFMPIEDLDSRAHPDRSLLYNDDFPGVKNNVIRNFIGVQGCPYACTYCFLGDALINTRSGLRSIMEIVDEKDEIQVFDGNGNLRRPTQFHKRNYTGDILSILLRKFCLPIEGTPNHEVFTERGRIKLNEVRPGDWIKIPIPKVENETPFMPPKLAGYYIAEGSLSRSVRARQTRFSFSSKERRYIDETKSLLKSQFDIEPREVTQGSVTHVEITRSFVYDFLLEKFGKGAIGKKIPVEVFGWSEKDKLDFMKGWFDGDGYAAQGMLATVSKTLAVQGYLLALSLGMRPNLYVRKINDSFIGDRRISSKNSCWTIAFTFNEDRKRLGLPEISLIGKYLRRRDYYQRFLEDGVYLKVKSVSKRHHEGRVYNLGIETEHSYTVNLVSVSNCFNSNPNWQAMVGKGKTRLRYHSPEWLVDDIEMTFSKWGGELVSFQDDIFGIDMDWLERFVRVYRRVRLPFFVQLRPRLITEDRVRLLKEAGVHIISFAIESGNQKTRKEVLDRDEPNELIERGCELLHRHGIKFRMQNMLGLPIDDPLGDALETLRFNMKCKPTLSWASALQAYPGTAIADWVVKKGLVESLDKLTYMVNSTFFEDCSLPIKNKRQIEHLHKWWSAVVRWQWLYPFVRLLIHVNLGRWIEQWIFETFKNYINRKEYWRVNHLDKHISITSRQTLDRLGNEPKRTNHVSLEVCA